MRRLAALLAGVLLLAVAQPSSAHELRPGYLQLRQSDPETYEVLWKVPARGDRRLSLQARLPESCRRQRPQAGFEGGGFVERWTAACPGGLVGQTVTVDGLSATLTDVLARVERLDGTSQVVRLTPTAPAFVVAAAPASLAVAGTFFLLGVEHILLGIDHLLFVLAMLILVTAWRRLVWTITAFTLAHSLTLAAATLGLVRVAPAPVEAVIALSIVFVAMEIVHARQGRPGLAERRPWLVAFAFGLLHGFGFAGALARLGLPEQEIPLALLFFNLGVEAGQLLFIAAVLALIALWRRFEAPWPAWAWRLPVYAIGSLAAFWTIERLAAL
jgi:hydrogenase/urease accessory protein HupE